MEFIPVRSREERLHWGKFAGTGNKLKTEKERQPWYGDFHGNSEPVCH